MKNPLTKPATAAPWVTIVLSDRLSTPDYEDYLPAFEHLEEELGELNLLVILEKFDGWDLHGIWEHLRFDARHFQNVHRIAFVGQRTWDEWIRNACKPFARAEVRYFEPGARDDAEEWLRSPNPAKQP